MCACRPKKSFRIEDILSEEPRAVPSRRFAPPAPLPAPAVATVLQSTLAAAVAPTPRCLSAPTPAPCLSAAAAAAAAWWRLPAPPPPPHLYPGYHHHSFPPGWWWSGGGGTCAPGPAGAEAATAPARRKGGQVRFTARQSAALERRFRAHRYLAPDARRRLARALALSDRQVKTWFQNRRAKWRRGPDSAAAGASPGPGRRSPVACCHAPRSPHRDPPEDVDGDLIEIR